MRLKPVIVMFGIGILLVLGVFAYFEHCPVKRQVKVHVENVRGKGDVSSSRNWIDDFWAVCDHMALMSSDKQPDYSIAAAWSQGRPRRRTGGRPHRADTRRGSRPAGARATPADR